MILREYGAGQGNAGLLPAVDPGGETLRCAGNAPLREGTLGVQRSSAAVLGTKAEKKQQALSSESVKRTIAAGMPSSLPMQVGATIAVPETTCVCLSTT